MRPLPFLPLLPTLGLLLLVLLAQPARAQHASPPPGVGGTGQVCFLLVNRSPVEIYGRVILKSRERYVFRLERGKRVEDCLIGTAYGGNRVSLVLVNYLGMPLFSCYTTVTSAIELYAKRLGNDEGWAYSATCR